MHITVYNELTVVCNYFQMQMYKHNNYQGTLINGLLDLIAVYEKK